MSILKPVLGSQLQLGHPLAEGLIGCWLMNEGSGNRINDLSGIGNVGTSYADTHFVPGDSGYALSFDGTGDYVDCGDMGGKPLNFTVIVRLKPTAWGATGFASGSTTAAGATVWGFLLLDSGDAVKIYVGNDASYSALVAAADWNSTGFPADSWTTIVATADGSTLTYYKNGLYVNSGVQAYQNTGTAYKFSIGRWGEYTAAFYYTGEVDHVMIYDRALSASKINQLYIDPSCMLKRDPIELWTAATSGAVVGAPGAMTLNAGYWGQVV